MKLTLVGFALQVISVRGKVVFFERFAVEEKNLQNPSAILCFSVSSLLLIVQKVVVSFLPHKILTLWGQVFLTVFQNLSGLLKVSLNSLR